MKSKRVLIILLALLPALALWSQTMLQGTVVNSNGDVLIGVSVSVKGTAVGTTTDTKGAFRLDLPDGDQVLLINYTGYGSREITVRDGLSAIEITLEEGIILRETVVTALGITRSEKSLGYAVAQVDGSELTKVRDVNIVNALAGRAAGVTVIGSSGNLGGSARITIRGIKSINGNNQPLFVVDGVPMDNSNFTNDLQAAGGSYDPEKSMYDYGNTIQDLNPDDIENISILKGQAAAALYGSRGANGVIMVSTKKGKSAAGGRRGIGVSVNSSLTVDNIFVFPKFQNTYGGGVDLYPRGYTDNSGHYQTSLVTYNADGSVSGTYQSFDLVPVYAVDESSGARFATSSDQHFQHLDGLTWSNGQDQYSFPGGFGANQNNLYFRDWNSWDAWDTAHFGQSRLWDAGDDPRKFFETGVTSNQNIAFEGGGDRSAFRLSYNRFDQKGIYPNSKMQRNTLSFNGSLDLNDQLQTFLGVNYVNSATTGRSASTYDFRGGFNPGQNFSQWWHTQLRFADLKQYLNPDGSDRTWNRRSADDPFPQYWDNPYWARYKNYETDGRDRVFGNAGLTYKINSWLSATGRVLTDFYSEQREERVSVGSVLASQYSQDAYDVNETNIDFILRAEKNLSDKLSFSAFGGANRLWRKVDRTYGTTVGGLNVPDIYRLQNSKDRPVIRNTLSKKQIESFFAGASFGWNSTVYLDLTGRQDWSSTLPDGANGYFYPSASASFVFSEMVKIPALSFGKLRLGWAKVGSDTDPYNIYTTYAANPNFGGNPNYTVSNTLNNRGLRPEQTTSVELGADLRFFKNRLGIDLTVYTGKTTDQIIPLATSPASGFVQQFINAGEITNKGIEIALSGTPLRTPNFEWEVVFNFGQNTNKVVSLIPDDPSVTNLPIAFAAFAGVSVNAYLDLPYGTILGTNYLYDKDGNKLISPSGDNKGFYMVSTDIMPIGNINPDFTGGFSNKFTWKGLTLQVFVDFRKGGDIFSVTNLWGRYSGLFAETAEGGVRENGVVNPGVLASVDNEGNPILDGGGGTDTKLDDTYQSTGQQNTEAVNFQAHNFQDGGYVLNKADVYDGSFIKLREVAIGYALPQRWLKWSGIREAHFSIVGRNLAILFKNLPHQDPDMAISTSNVQGLEGGAPPSTRSIGVNLNFKF